MYGYFHEDSIPENSPEELTRYRQKYLQIMKDLKTTQPTADADEIDVATMRQSLVTNNVYIVATNPFCTYKIKSLKCSRKSLDL